MKRVLAVTAAFTLLGSGIAAQADVFNLGAGYSNLETVTVGDPGNAADTRYATPGSGSVAYTYKICTYEVTAKQYCDFLNAKAKSSNYGLYNSSMWMGSGGCLIQRTGSTGDYTYTVADNYANRPVNFVTFWDACRFANWLCNHQGDCDIETGAYTLNGYHGTDGRNIQRNPGWTWAVASVDEWYKAAYYKGGGTNAGYWDYPTAADSIDTSQANYGRDEAVTTPVGTYPHPSAYGTFDQGGNVLEWNENVVNTTFRALRGGGCCDDYLDLRASGGASTFASASNAFVGFRLVQAVPEPSSILALAGGLISLLCMKRRRA